MTLELDKLDFPIVNILPELNQTLITDKTLIVNAETGAGKSTILPLSLLKEAKLRGKKIIMLEPRRLAVKSIAHRMASLLSEEIGKSIGYSIRFESKKSEETQIEIVTEGILTRMLVSDPLLSDYFMIIFDEFHERSIHADLGLALVRELQQERRKDLQILLMSATLNKSELSEALNAQIINSKGRTFPVDIEYIGQGMKEFNPEPIIHQIKESVKNDEGDILVFLPGQGEIREVNDALYNLRSKVAIMQLFGQLSWSKQQQAILPHPEGKRKVVLATSIAETSLTIEGVKVVIDCGLGRSSEYDASIGLSRLVTHPISKDEADQRSGRAGRVSAGKCYRMWSENEHNFRPNHRTPEILNNDLTPLRLDLYAKNIQNPNSLFWLSSPPIDKILEAESLLKQLEAVENERITELGKQMHAIPCHPRLAHMLTHRISKSNLALATDIAAFLEEKDTAYKIFGADLSARVSQLRSFRAEKRLSKSLKKIEKIASSYRKLLGIEADNKAIDDYEVGFLLSLAYPDRIASAKRGNNAQFQLANGAIASIGHKDDLADEAWLAVAAMDARQGLGKIFLAAPLNPKDLAPLLKAESTPYWDYEEDLFEYRSELKIGRIILKSEYLDDIEDKTDIKKAVIKAIQEEGEDLLTSSPEFEEFCRSIQLMRQLHPSQGWPEMSMAYIKALSPIWINRFELPDEDILTFIQNINLLELAKSLLKNELLNKIKDQ